jgi:hypothetical protein
MVSSGTLNIIKFVKLDKSFLFIDDCGNEWIVEYDSMYYTPFTAFLTASEIIYEVTGVNGTNKKNRAVSSPI